MLDSAKQFLLKTLKQQTHLRLNNHHQSTRKKILKTRTWYLICFSRFLYYVFCQNDAIVALLISDVHPVLGHADQSPKSVVVVVIIIIIIVVVVGLLWCRCRLRCSKLCCCRLWGRRRWGGGIVGGNQWGNLGNGQTLALVAVQFSLGLITILVKLLSIYKLFKNLL